MFVLIDQYQEMELNRRKVNLDNLLNNNSPITSILFFSFFLKQNLPPNCIKGTFQCDPVPANHS